MKTATIGLAAVGLTDHLVQAISVEANKAIANKLFPGCAIHIIKQNPETFGHSEASFIERTLYFGKHTYEEHATVVSEQSVYDLASITKMMVGMLALRLISKDYFELDTLVKEVVPEFSGNHAESVTIRHLLTNTVELNLDDKLSTHTPEEIWEHIMSVGLRYPPGTYHKHRNTTSMLLAKVIEETTGFTIDERLATGLFSPLGMHNTTCHPLKFFGDKRNIVPTEEVEYLDDKKLLWGDVHDELSRMFYPKITGVAGVFAPISDMALLAKMILSGRKWNNYHFLEEHESNESKLLGYQMRRNQISHLSGHQFGFAWDKFFPGYSPCSCFTEEAIVSAGFTGTSMTLWPEKHFGLIILSNTVHPVRQPHQAMKEFRQRITNLCIYCKHCMD